MKRTVLLVAAMSLVTIFASAQFRYRDNEREGVSSYLKIGTQVPLQHAVQFDYGITPGFSLTAGLGFITEPYTSLIFNTLENRNVITANERRVADRSFQFGISYLLGANVHFDKNYVRLFGQYAHINGDMTLTDLANLYLNTNLPNITSFLNPIDIRANVPMLGFLYGRRFQISDRSEFHIEGSISKSLGSSRSYKTGTFIDNLDIAQDLIYRELDNDIENYFLDNGWFPSVNIYYVFKF